MSIYNNSRLRVYEKCPRQYYYSHVLDLRRKSEWSDQDRDEGTLIHAMLAAWLDPKDPHNSVEVERLWNEHFRTSANAAELDIERDHILERAEYIWKLWEAYLKRYPKESWTVVDVEREGITCLGDKCYKCDEPYEQAIVEGKVITRLCMGRLEDGDFCYAAIHYIVGVADLLYIENNLFKIGDHKTKGGKSPSIGDAFLASFSESRQFTGYMYIFSRNAQRDVEMGMVNGIAKLKTIDARGNPFKRREDIVRTSYDYDEFVKDTLNLIEAIEHDLNELDDNGVPHAGNHPFRRNTDACRDFGLCPFYGICHPSRPDWWTLPFDVVDDYEQKSGDYVKDYRKMIKEEVT